MKNSLYQFLNNKYTLTYDKLIHRARFRMLDGYVEEHHIIPQCLLKTDDVVKLTAREHLLCHLLLTKMTDGNANYKMHWALHRMMSGSKTFHPGRKKVTSRAYEHARLKFIQLLKQPKSEEHKRKISEALKGHSVSDANRKAFIKRNSRPHSQETKDRMSRSAIGKPKSDEMKTKLARSKTGVKRPPFSDEWKKSISLASKGRPKSEETKKRMSEVDRSYMKSDNWKESHSNAMKKRIGKIFINDGSKNRIIFPEDLIPIGWKRGMIRGIKNQGLSVQLL